MIVYSEVLDSLMDLGKRLTNGRPVRLELARDATGRQVVTIFPRQTSEPMADMHPVVVSCV